MVHTKGGGEGSTVSFLPSFAKFVYVTVYKKDKDFKEVFDTALASFITTKLLQVWGVGWGEKSFKDECTKEML